jgi:hypothetical protein
MKAASRSAERSEERGWRRGGQIETGSKLKTSLARAEGVVHANVCGGLEVAR